MGVTLHLQIGLTVQRPAVEENRHGLALALILNHSWVVKTALVLDQTLKKENVTHRNAQVTLSLMS